MGYELVCPCGKRLSISAAQAGSEVQCGCGMALSVPSLGELNRGVTSPTQTRAGEPSAQRSAASAARNEKREPASGELIVCRDLSAMRWTAFAVLFPILAIVFVVVYFLPGIREQVVLPWYLLVFGPLALLGIAVLLITMATSRVRRIQDVVNNGPRVEGELYDVWYSLPWPLSRTPRGILRYRYVYDGRANQSETEVFQSEATRGYAVGDRVEVAVDPREPATAFIVQLYCQL